MPDDNTKNASTNDTTLISSINTLSDVINSFVNKTVNIDNKELITLIKDGFNSIGSDVRNAFYDAYLDANDDIEDKKNIKEILSNYFLEKIIMVEPNYDKNTLDEINIQVEEITKLMNNLTFKDKKDFDKEMQKIKEAKNKLYGIDLNDSKKRALVRKRIDEFEKANNEEQLEKYPIYLENRSKIFELAQELENYEKQKENLETLQRELNILNQKKSSLISKENKEEIIQFENELKNINRIKID